MINRWPVTGGQCINCNVHPEQARWQVIIGSSAQIPDLITEQAVWHCWLTVTTYYINQIFIFFIQFFYKNLIKRCTLTSYHTLFAYNEQFQIPVFVASHSLLTHPVSHPARSVWCDKDSTKPIDIKATDTDLICVIKSSVGYVGILPLAFRLPSFT